MLVTAVQDLHQDPSRSMRIAALAQDRNALGAFGWVNRDWIPVSLLAAATALLVLAINPGDIIRGPLFAVLVAYPLLTFAAAICSWHGIEKPALTLKSRFSEPDR
jgi:hypothetical protein